MKSYAKEAAKYTKRSYRSALSTVLLHRGHTKVSVFGDLSESLQNRSVGKDTCHSSDLNLIPRTNMVEKLSSELHTCTLCVVYTHTQ